MKSLVALCVVCTLQTCDTRFACGVYGGSGVQMNVIYPCSPGQHVHIVQLWSPEVSYRGTCRDCAPNTFKNHSRCEDCLPCLEGTRSCQGAVQCTTDASLECSSGVHTRMPTGDVYRFQPRTWKPIFCGQWMIMLASSFFFR